MATDSKEKVKNLEQALQQIEKQFGKGAIMKFGETEVQKVEAIPTGCLTLDIALGIGGIPYIRKTAGRFYRGKDRHRSRQAPVRMSGNPPCHADPEIRG